MPPDHNDVVLDQRGAFRSAAVQPLCKVCGEEAPASSACARCRACFCAAHAVKPGERCPDCEGIYALLERERKLDPINIWVVWAGYGVLSGVLVLLARVLPRPCGIWITVGVFLLLALWPLYYAAWRRLRARTRFMAEAPGGPKRLPPRDLPPPNPAAQQELSQVGLVMALIFFIPGASLIGLVLGIVARWRSGSSGADGGLALGAIIVGGLITVVQTVLLVAITLTG